VATSKKRGRDKRQPKWSSANLGGNADHALADTEDQGGSVANLGRRRHEIEAGLDELVSQPQQAP
jgi:hypothetical protein